MEGDIIGQSKAISIITDGSKLNNAFKQLKAVPSGTFGVRSTYSSHVRTISYAAERIFPEIYQTRCMEIRKS